MNEDCYVRLFSFLFIVVLKYDGSYSTGSGRNEFSCISVKIWDSLYKEHVGNFSFFRKLYRKAWGMSDHCTELFGVDTGYSTASSEFCH